MEFRITHGPAAPRNDLQFVKAGTLRVTPQVIEFSGKWRMVMPGKSVFWAYIVPLLFIAALSDDHWVPQVWRTGIGDHIYETLKILLYFFFAIGLILQGRPFSKKITANRETLRETPRSGRELTFLFRDRKGRECSALFNTDTEGEAAAIETALREGGTERIFTITYGPAAAPRPIMPVPGQIVIGPDNVHLTGRIPRDPLPDRRQQRIIRLVAFIGAVLAVLVPVILMISSSSSGSAFVYPAVYEGITLAVIMLMMIGAVIYIWRRRSIADVTKAEIADIRQQGQEVSFRAPLEGNHGVSGVTTVMQAGSPEQAATIAQALAARTEGSTPFTVNYGHYGLKWKVNPFGLAGKGRLRVAPDAVRITGYRSIFTQSLSMPAVIGLFLLAIVPSVIAFVLAWRTLHDAELALFISMLVPFVISAVLSLLPRLLFRRVTIPRRDITGVERDGRQLTLRAQIAGQEEQAVFHTRTEEDAATINDALLS